MLVVFRGELYQMLQRNLDILHQHSTLILASVLAVVGDMMIYALESHVKSDSLVDLFQNAVNFFTTVFPIFFIICEGNAWDL